MAKNGRKWGEFSLFLMFNGYDWREGKPLPCGLSGVPSSPLKTKRIMHGGGNPFPTGMRRTAGDHPPISACLPYTYGVIPVGAACRFRRVAARCVLMFCGASRRRPLPLRNNPVGSDALVAPINEAIMYGRGDSFPMRLRRTAGGHIGPPLHGFGCSRRGGVPPPD